MPSPRIYADFLNLDDHNRLRLTCIGTIKDLDTHGIQLREGLTLTFYTDDADDQGNPDDLLVDGVLTFSPEQQAWVAAVDWNAIRNESDEVKESVNVVASSEASAAPSKRLTDT
jgi:hypothetical protein